MPRPIDHLVLAVPDLTAAVGLYRALGFTVGARNRHPWGTENAVVQLAGAYLELIGLAEHFRSPKHDDNAAPFADAVAAAVARGGGLAMMAMRAIDADQDAARFEAAGIGQGRRLDFSRHADAPDGTRRELSFGLAFTDNPSLPEAGVFTCRHHHSETFWNPAARIHPNGGLRLDDVVLTVAEPPAHLSFFAAICDAAPTGKAARPSFETGTGRIDLMTPQDVRARYGPTAAATPGRFAGFGVIVESLDAVRACCDRAGIPHGEIACAVVVPPERAFGVALAFTAAPRHSQGRTTGRLPAWT